MRNLKTIDIKLQKIQEYLSLGKNGDALEILDTIKGEPTLEYFLFKAKVLYNLSEDEKSISYLKKALLIEQTNQFVLKTLGDLLFKKAIYDQAAFYYEKLASLTKSADIYFFTAQSYFVTNKFLQSFRYANLAYKQGCKKAHKLLGQIALFKQKYQLAYNILQEYDKSDDDLCNLGTIHWQQKKYQDAVTFYTKCLCENENHTQARTNLALLFKEQTQFQNALTHFKLIKNPSLQDLYNIGICLSALGEYQEALKFFCGINSFDSFIQMSSVYLSLNDIFNAKDCLKKALAIKPNLKIPFKLSPLLDKKITSTPKSYIKYLYDNLAYGYDLIKENQKINDYVGSLIKSNSVLDVGCGTGLLGKHKNVECGIDINTNMIKYAKNKGNYTNLINKDFFALKHVQKYDYVVCINVLYHFFDLDEKIESLYKNLADKGTLIFSVIKSNEENTIFNNFALFSHSHNNIVSTLQKYKLQFTYNDLKNTRVYKAKLQ